MTARLPIIGVMGSGTSARHADRAEAVGRWLATERVHLLTGGGGALMGAASRAFHGTPGRAGLVIGIVPCSDDPQRPKAGYPNPWVEIPIFTHLPLSGPRGTELMSRNHINVLSSNAIIALPGGPGTATEVALALRYGRPIAAYLAARSDIPGLPSEVQVFSELRPLQEFVRVSLSRA